MWNVVQGDTESEVVESGDRVRCGKRASLGDLDDDVESEEVSEVVKACLQRTMVDVMGFDVDPDRRAEGCCGGGGEDVTGEHRIAADAAQVDGLHQRLNSDESAGGEADQRFELDRERCHCCGQKPPCPIALRRRCECHASG